MFSKKYYSPEGDANAGGGAATEGTENTGTENAGGESTKSEEDEIAELESEAATNTGIPKEPEAMSDKNKFKTIEELEAEETAAAAEKGEENKDETSKKCIPFQSLMTDPVSPKTRAPL